MIFTVLEKNSKFDKYVPLNWRTILITFLILFLLIFVLVIIGLI